MHLLGIYFENVSNETKHFAKLLFELVVHVIILIKI
jgi:hypothetical protein